MSLDQKRPKNYRKAWNGGVRPITGVDLIATERARQMCVEGWTPAHDAQHHLGEMVSAAMCYSLCASFQTRKQDVPRDLIFARWPWEWSWWKPSDDPIRNLEKAGALIAAEIDRLQNERSK